MDPSSARAQVGLRTSIPVKDHEQVLFCKQHKLLSCGIKKRFPNLENNNKLSSFSTHCNESVKKNFFPTSTTGLGAAQRSPYPLKSYFVLLKAPLSSRNVVVICLLWSRDEITNPDLVFFLPWLNQILKNTKLISGKTNQWQKTSYTHNLTTSRVRLFPESFFFSPGPVPLLESRDMPFPLPLNP